MCVVGEGHTLGPSRRLLSTRSWMSFTAGSWRGATMNSVAPIGRRAFRSTPAPAVAQHRVNSYLTCASDVLEKPIHLCLARSDTVI